MYIICHISNMAQLDFDESDWPAIIELVKSVQMPKEFYDPTATATEAKISIIIDLTNEEDEDIEDIAALGSDFVNVEDDDGSPPAEEATSSKIKVEDDEDRDDDEEADDRDDGDEDDDAAGPGRQRQYFERGAKRVKRENSSPPPAPYEGKGKGRAP